MYNGRALIEYMGKRAALSGDVVSELTAVILAGGLGTRLRTVIGHSQKVMANVGDKPFIEHIFKQVADVGIKDVVLCTGFMSEQVQAYFGSQYHGVNVKYSIEQLLLGTAGALRFALSQIESEDFLVLNGDSHCKADLEAFFQSHQENKANVSMLLVEVPDTQRYGRVEFNDKFEITNFEEKGSAKGQGWINAGIYILSKQVLEALPKGHNISLERDVFPDLIGNGFYAFCSKGSEFIDIGVPESFETAKKMYSAKDYVKHEG